jgi:hypothetical protein
MQGHAWMDARMYIRYASGEDGHRLEQNWKREAKQFQHAKYGGVAPALEQRLGAKERGKGRYGC